MGRGDHSFRTHCLNFFIWDIGRATAMLDRFDCQRLAVDHQVPQDLLEAFILIESNRRPAWLRLVENFVLLANGLLYVLFAVPVRDFSIGVLQVRLTVAAPLLGLPSDARKHGWLILSGQTTAWERIRTFQSLWSATDN